MNKAIQGWKRTRPGIYHHESGARIWSSTAPSLAGQNPLHWETCSAEGIRHSGLPSMSEAMRVAQPASPIVPYGRCSGN